jgi:hypothetical protein
MYSMNQIYSTLWYKYKRFRSLGGFLSLPEFDFSHLADQVFGSLVSQQSPLCSQLKEEVLRRIEPRAFVSAGVPAVEIDHLVCFRDDRVPTLSDRVRQVAVTTLHLAGTSCAVFDSHAIWIERQCANQPS